MDDIKVVKVDKDGPSVLKFKTTFDENQDYEGIFVKDTAIEGDMNEEEESDAKPKLKGRRRNMKQEERVLINMAEVNSIPMYKNRPSISERKKKDLRKLLEKNVIPNCYSYFYNSL